MRTVWRRGVTLIELIAAAVILGVLALIVVPNVVSSAHLSKPAAFATTLATLQDGSDQFYGIAGAYPTYTGTTVANQPGACPDAFELQPQAATATGSAFIPTFLRSAPQAAPSWAGLDLAAGTQVYYGVASGGLVFATQVPPEQNGDEWTLAGTPVYTQDYASPADPTTLGFLCQGIVPLQGDGLTASAQVSGSTVTVSGQAPPNDALTISVMDPQVQSVTASSTGSYSATFANAYTAGQPTIITVTNGAGHLAQVIIQADGTILNSNGTTGSVSPSVTVSVIAHTFSQSLTATISATQGDHLLIVFDAAIYSGNFPGQVNGQAVLNNTTTLPLLASAAKMGLDGYGMGQLIWTATAPTTGSQSVTISNLSGFQWITSGLSELLVFDVGPNVSFGSPQVTPVIAYATTNTLTVPAPSEPALAILAVNGVVEHVADVTSVAWPASVSPIGTEADPYPFTYSAAAAWPSNVGGTVQWVTSANAIGNLFTLVPVVSAP